MTTIVNGVFTSGLLSNWNGRVCESSVFEQFDDLSGRLLRFSATGPSFKILQHDGKTIELHQEIPDTHADVSFEISFNLNDLTSGVDHSASNMCVFTQDLQVEGYLYANVPTIVFDNCVFRVHQDGYFQIGYYIIQHNGVPLSLEASVIYINGSYGRDAYKFEDRAVAGPGGTLVVAGACIKLEGNRSDFDFHKDSTVYLYNSTITGTQNSYHHLNSDDMYFFDVTYKDVTSVEFQGTAKQIQFFNTINCTYGFSFYPVSEPPFVVIRNLNIIQSQNYYLKRNHYSAIFLVDTPLPEQNEMKMSGSAPIRFHFSIKDQFTLAASDQLETNVKVAYFEPAVEFVEVNGDSVLFEQEIEFVRFKVGDRCVFTGSDVESYPNDEQVYIVKSINALSVTLDRPIEETTQRLSVVHLVETPTEVFLPFAAVPKGHSDVFLFDAPIRVIEHKGMTLKNLVHISPAGQKNIHVLDSDVPADPGGGEWETKLMDAINSMETNLSAENVQLSQLCGDIYGSFPGVVDQITTHLDDELEKSKTHTDEGFDAIKGTLQVISDNADQNSTIMTGKLGDIEQMISQISGNQTCDLDQAALISEISGIIDNEITILQSSNAEIKQLVEDRSDRLETQHQNILSTIEENTCESGEGGDDSKNGAQDMGEESEQETEENEGEEEETAEIEAEEQEEKSEIQEPIDEAGNLADIDIVSMYKEAYNEVLGPDGVEVKFVSSKYLTESDFRGDILLAYEKFYKNNVHDPIIHVILNKIHLGNMV